MQSRTPAIPSNAWFKSSYSGANTSECAEVAALAVFTAVRDSKVPDGPRIAVRRDSWVGFIRGVQRGEFGAG
ncbi:DUF397 domain-containing protein [Streptomyces spiramyceticus]|uniref:DUF397 domain-containing protein n=1 Tax=Streptomyces spiramyceticus TaxID=299717 RepID=UPI00237C0014|nr:DUF397 domain-containing protein [Streptomyces spiramyceticus]